MSDKTPILSFRNLHEQPELFIIPNPWDVGSAKILASMGFKALATTSAGYAHSRGLEDGAVSFGDMLNHCREIVAATPLPVSADLEKGLGDEPETAAETVRQATLIPTCRTRSRRTTATSSWKPCARTNTCSRSAT
jgi:2-methylisocitrate lyase-like PEP mutase family enzyme